MSWYNHKLTAEHVIRLILSTFKSCGIIYDYAIHVRSWRQFDLAVKPDQSNQFVYIPITI